MKNTPDASNIDLNITNPWDFFIEEYKMFFIKAFQLLNFNGITGDYVEFGSHMARTFTLAYHAQNNVLLKKHYRHQWAFDSFQGLPQPTTSKDSHPMWKQGSYTTGLTRFVDLCISAGLNKECFTTIPGFYEETLNKEIADQNLPSDIALAFVDCDMYSSTKSVLNFLEPKLKHGMIIAFDDYYCLSEDQASGEKLAFVELAQGITDFSFCEYCNFHFAGKSYIVEKNDFC